DVRHMLNALKALGVQYELSEDRTLCTIVGEAGPLVTKGGNAPVDLFLGNAGTAMRPLCAMLCTGSGEFNLTGEPRMYERPIGDLVDSLRSCGATIDYIGNAGYPPLHITANGLLGGQVNIKGNISSQFLTAMLMAAPFCASDLEIVVDGELVSKPYILITLDVMAKFGVEVQNDNYRRFVIRAGQHYTS